MPKTKLINSKKLTCEIKKIKLSGIFYFIVLYWAKVLSPKTFPKFYDNLKKVDISGILSVVSLSLSAKLSMVYT